MTFWRFILFFFGAVCLGQHDGLANMEQASDDLENAYFIANSQRADTSKTILQNIEARRSSLGKQLNEADNAASIRGLKIELEKLNFIEPILGNPENKKQLDEWTDNGRSRTQFPRFKNLPKSKLSQFNERCLRLLSVKSLVLAAGLGVAAPVVYKVAPYLANKNALNALDEQISDAENKKIYLTDRLAYLKSQIQKNEKQIAENEKTLESQDPYEVQKAKNENLSLKSEAKLLHACLTILEQENEIWENNEMIKGHVDTIFHDNQHPREEDVPHWKEIQRLENVNEKLRVSIEALQATVAKFDLGAASVELKEAIERIMRLGVSGANRTHWSNR